MTPRHSGQTVVIKKISKEVLTERDQEEVKLVGIVEGCFDIKGAYQWTWPAHMWQRPPWLWSTSTDRASYMETSNRQNPLMQNPSTSSSPTTTSITAPVFG